MRLANIIQKSSRQIRIIHREITSRNISTMRFCTVDAFTSVPYEGNSAAIVTLKESIDETKMQKIATEMNLSETAYLEIIEPKGECAWKGSSKFKLRWFTPTNEVNLCGHATLASAHVLFNEIGNTSSILEFETKSGILTARRKDKLIILDLPSSMPEVLSNNKSNEYLKYIKAVVGDRSVKNISLSHKTKKLLVQLEDDISRKELESLTVDFSTLNQYDGKDFKGIIVTVKSSESRYDFFSRYFAPWNGIPEDPVTGSAHSVLGPFWGALLNKTELSCRQCSKRGGDLYLELKGDRIDVAGECITTLEGRVRT